MQPILYQFFTPGYIPGYPSQFPAGTWAKIDPVTNALLETGTIAVGSSAETSTDVTMDVSSGSDPSESENVVNLSPPTTGNGG